MADPEYNILINNITTLLDNTELKRNENSQLSLLDDISRDIVRFYATFFTFGDRKKA